MVTHEFSLGAFFDAALKAGRHKQAASSLPLSQRKNTSIGELFETFVLENTRQCWGLTKKIYVGFALALRLFAI
jgi:hypothetical protein